MATESATATHIAPAAQAWLQVQTKTPAPVQVRYLSAAAVNLIRPNGRVLALVTPAVGPGPFSLVLDRPVPLDELITTGDQPRLNPDALQVGRLDIFLASVQTWSPIPAWPAGQAPPVNLAPLQKVLADAAPASLAGLTLSPTPQTPLLAAAMAPVAALLGALRRRDLPAAVAAAAGLTGLGPGLTPAGDDFVMGVCFALWFNWPAPTASRWAAALAAVPPGATTLIAAAYRAAAARGEAVAGWHHLVAALNAGIEPEIEAAGRQLLALGHTSGADGLTGFVLGLGT